MIFTFAKTPSLNIILRMHWAKRSKLLDAYRWDIRWQVAELFALSIDLPPKKRRNVVVRRYSSGELDHDNFVGGCKALIDALCRENVIRDDSSEWLDCKYEQHRVARRCGRTEVEVS